MANHATSMVNPDLACASCERSLKEHQVQYKTMPEKLKQINCLLCGETSLKGCAKGAPPGASVGSLLWTCSKCRWVMVTMREVAENWGGISDGVSNLKDIPTMMSKVKEMSEVTGQVKEITNVVDKMKEVTREFPLLVKNVGEIKSSSAGIKEVRNIVGRLKPVCDGWEIMMKNMNKLGQDVKTLGQKIDTNLHEIKDAVKVVKAAKQDDECMVVEVEKKPVKPLHAGQAFEAPLKKDDKAMPAKNAQAAESAKVPSLMSVATNKSNPSKPPAAPPISKPVVPHILLKQNPTFVEGQKKQTENTTNNSANDASVVLPIKPLMDNIPSTEQSGTKRPAEEQQEAGDVTEKKAKKEGKVVWASDDMLRVLVNNDRMQVAAYRRNWEMRMHKNGKISNISNTVQQELAKTRYDHVVIAAGTLDLINKTPSTSLQAIMHVVDTIEKLVILAQKKGCEVWVVAPHPRAALDSFVRKTCCAEIGDVLKKHWNGHVIQLDSGEPDEHFISSFLQFDGRTFKRERELDAVVCILNGMGFDSTLPENTSLRHQEIFSDGQCWTCGMQHTKGETACRDVTMCTICSMGGHHDSVCRARFKMCEDCGRRGHIPSKCPNPSTYGGSMGYTTGAGKGNQEARRGGARGGFKFGGGTGGGTGGSTGGGTGGGARAGNYGAGNKRW